MRCKQQIAYQFYVSQKSDWLGHDCLCLLFIWTFCVDLSVCWHWVHIIFNFCVAVFIRFVLCFVCQFANRREKENSFHFWRHDTFAHYVQLVSCYTFIFMNIKWGYTKRCCCCIVSIDLILLCFSSLISSSSTRYFLT